MRLHLTYLAVIACSKAVFTYLEDQGL
jgi:hypothetical protein